jgi:hypothetical protein
MQKEDDKLIYKIKQERNIYSGELNLIFRTRMFWRDLATWLRSYLVSLYGNLQITDEISIRLHELPTDYANILSLFFGDKITEEYLTLLNVYISTFEALFHAHKEGDSDAVGEYTRQLYENDSKRAAFLAQINPYWLENDLRSLMNNFTSMTIEESTTILTQEYDKNIDIFGRLLSHTTLIGDYFSEGLLNYLGIGLRPINPTSL